MVKKIVLVFLLLAALGGLTAALVYYAALPKNAPEQLDWARQRETKNNVAITRLKSALTRDQARIDELEDDSDAAFQTVLDKYPASPEAEEADYHLIERARLRGRLAGRELIERLEKFVADHPETTRKPDILLRIAEIFAKDLDLKGEAITRYRDFLEQHPDHERAPDALFEIGKIEEEIKEFEAAEKTYTELIEKHPDHPLAVEAQYRRANLRADQLDKKDEALEDFEKVEEKAPQSAQGRTARARRQEVGKERAEERKKEAQEEYYGAREMGGYAMPTDDWNDPTVDVIRAQGADVRSVAVVLWLDPAASGLKAEADVVVGANDREVRDTFIFQFNGGVDISKLAQDGKDVTFEQKGNFLHVALAAAMQPGTTTTFRFEYAGTTDPLWKGDVVSDKGTYLRPESRWYPYLVWGDEFTATVDIIAPEGITAVGPGELVARAAATDTLGGGPGERWSWKQDIPIGLLAIVANRYEMRERDLRPDLKLQAYIYPEHAEFIDLYLDELAAIVTHYEGLLGPFPYRRMAVAEIPFFPGGYGSPTLLMITEMVFKESHRVVAEFLAHEVAHQWFGNLLGLTLEEDSHPWLSEAFATYVDALYIEHRRGRDRFIQRVREMGSLYIESLVAFEDAPVLEALWDNPMYRTLAYEKGGHVLHTLRWVMGDAKFFEALRGYIARFSHKTVTVADFQATMEEYHGAPLDWFFDQWLRDIGYPHYKIAEASFVERAAAGAASGAATEAAAPASAPPAGDVATDDAPTSAPLAVEEAGAGEDAPPADGAAAEGAAAAAAASPRAYVTTVRITQDGDMVFRGPVEVRVVGAGEEERVSLVLAWEGEAKEMTAELVSPFRPARALIDPDGWILKYPSIDDTEREVVAAAVE